MFIQKRTKVKNVTILLNYHRRIKQEYIDILINFANEVLSKIDDRMLIRIFLFPRINDLEDFILEKAYLHGVLITGREMLSYHEAYSGFPTIYTSSEILEKYGLDFWRAIIHHEISHAILHGSPIYYILPEDYTLDLTLAYAIFIGIKDFEVSSFLLSLDLAKFQKPLVNYHIKDTDFNDLPNLIKSFLLVLPLKGVIREVDNFIAIVQNRLNIPSNSVNQLLEALSKSNNTFDRFRIAESWISEKVLRR